jgi:predicted AAA+ superfamily ATPase
MKYLRVLAAGSLLEVFSKKEGFSFPVGRVRNLYMYPLSFREYLDCKNPPLAQKLFNLDLNKKTDIHNILLEQFYEYAFIGGMPEVSSVYLDTGSYSELREVYDSIFMGYIEDVEKYSNLANAKYLSHTIDRAPLYAGERITYEKFAESSYRSREIREAFETLEKALILYRARPTSSTQIPIFEKIRMAPKLFFLDVGLVNFRIGFKDFFTDRQSLNQVYQGRIAEQIVAQEIVSQEYMRPKLHFWAREKGEAEIDFLFPFKDLLIPVEVKSGVVGKLRSLFLFMEKCGHPYAVRIYSGENRIDKVQLASGKKFYLHSIPFYFLPRLNEVITQLTLKY